MLMKGGRRRTRGSTPIEGGEGAAPSAPERTETGTGPIGTESGRARARQHGPEADHRTKIAWLLLLVGAAVAGYGALLRLRGRSLDRHARLAGEALRVSVEQNLKELAGAVETDALEAAQVPELLTAVDVGADRRTLENLFEDQEWWSPYRGRYAVGGVIGDRGLVAIAGIEGRGLAGAPLVLRAREAGSASGVLVVGGTPYLTGAARMPPGKRSGAEVVVLLATPVDRTVLQTLSARAPSSAALAISDGARLTGAVGTDEQRGLFLSMVGREARAVLPLGDDRWGMSWSIEGSLWMLALLPASAPDDDLPAHIDVVAIAAGAALLLAALLVASLRRWKAAPSDGRAARLPGGGDGDRPLRVQQQIGSSGGEVDGSIDDVTAGDAQNGDGDGDGDGDSDGSDGDVARPPSGSIAMGRYRLIERIGEGGMAEIFMATLHGAAGFTRKFVVKRMHPHLARNREAVHQFIDEARLQSGLVHSNIVPVFDFGKAGDEYYLALEHIHGKDLDRLVRRHVEVFGRPLSFAVAFYVMQEVLEALSYAHSRVEVGRPAAIVHRDVSPGNVLVSYRGEVKLGDFGIAKADQRLSRTEVGILKGNLSFMSPEQARGESVDRRSDLFSAGMVLYYCLTGRLRHGENEAIVKQLLRAASGPVFTDLDDGLSQLPPVVTDVLRRALAPDPAERYQSAREFSLDLGMHFTTGRGELGDLMDQLFPERSSPGYRPT
jgi:hypothetical protein